MDELVDIEATFTDANGDKFSVRSCRSIGACLAFAERPIKNVEFSLDAEQWVFAPVAERDKQTRLRWIGDCRDCVDSSEVGVEYFDPSSLASKLVSGFDQLTGSLATDSVKDNHRVTTFGVEDD